VIILTAICASSCCALIAGRAVSAVGSVFGIDPLFDGPENSADGPERFDIDNRGFDFFLFMRIW